MVLDQEKKPGIKLTCLGLSLCCSTRSRTREVHSFDTRTAQRVSKRIATAVTLTSEHHLADILAVVTIIVGIQILCQFGVGHALFPVDALFAGGKAVGDNGEAASVHAHVVVIGAAVGDVDAFFDQPVLEKVEDQLGLALCLIGQVMNDPPARCVNGDLQVLPVQLPQNIDVWLDRIRMRHHFIVGGLKYLCHVDLDGIIHGVFHAGNAHPMAPGRNTAAGKLLGIAAAHEAFHQRLVAGVTRPALLVFEQVFNGLAEEFGVNFVVHTDRQVAGNVDLIRSIQREIAQVAGRIVIIAVRAAELPIAAVLQKHTGEIEDSFLVGENARLDIPFIERVEQVFQLSAGAAAVVSTADHAEPVAPLDRFPEGFGRLRADAVVDRGHFMKICRELFVLLLTGKRLDLVTGTVDKGDNGFHHRNFRVVELRVTFVVQRFLLFQLPERAAPSDIQTNLDVGGKVMAVIDAGNDLVAVKYYLKIIIRVIGIPFFVLRTKPLQEQKALGRKSVERIHIDWMLGKQGAVVFLPRLISVNGAVGVIGLQLVMEDVLFDQAVIVLVRAAGGCLFFCLLDFAGTQKRDPLPV